MGDLNWANLEGTGKPRILLATRDDGHLYCLDDEGNAEWVFSPPGVQFASSLSVYQRSVNDPTKLVIALTSIEDLATRDIAIPTLKYRISLIEGRLGPDPR